MFPSGNKVVEVLELIASKSSISQRELARSAQTSLGHINTILRDFLKNGYILVDQLNKKKLRYILTPEGIKERSRIAYEKAISTIDRYRRLQSSVAELIIKLHQAGYDYFSIHGDGELKDLIEETFATCLEDAPVRLGKEPREGPCSVILNVTSGALEPRVKVDVVNILEKVWI